MFKQVFKIKLFPTENAKINIKSAPLNGTFSFLKENFTILYGGFCAGQIPPARYG